MIKEDKITVFIERLQKIGVELAELLSKDMQYHTISANQCGLTEQIFVTRVNNNYTTYFNPELLNIARADDEVPLVEAEETCQNFPTMSYLIKRPTNIRVQYKDYMGNNKMTWLYNLPARFWLKGYDHVNGLTCYDRQHTTTTKLPQDMNYYAQN